MQILIAAIYQNFTISYELIFLIKTWMERFLQLLVAIFTTSLSAVCVYKRRYKPAFIVMFNLNDGPTFLCYYTYANYNLLLV